MIVTDSAIARFNAPRLTIFNHKGGVGKTTITVNVAFALAKMGKRVLLVDSDPQANLTSYLVEESVVDDLLDNSDKSTGATIWSALKPVAEGSGSVKRVKTIEITDNLALLPGDIRLAEFEQELNGLWGECFQRKIKGLRGTSALSELVNNVAERVEADLVFYDSGPNIGALNRVILLDCDHFIVPAACDLFSLRAIKTLGHTLAGWIGDWQTILELAPEDIYLLPGRPKLMGYIPQRFSVYAKKLASAYAKFIPQIERAIQSDLVTVLKRVDPDLVPRSQSLRLGEIKDFGNLAPKSQEEGRWIADVSVGTSEQHEAAREVFNQVALRIIQRSGLA
jgi:cellulose biosynthesis protein BcsQ